MLDQLISQEWRFLYFCRDYYKQYIHLSHRSQQIALCLLGMLFDIWYVTWEFKHSCSKGTDARFPVVIGGWVLLFLFLLQNFNFVDCFWQDKLCPNMRIRFNLKDRKDWRKYRGAAGDNLARVKGSKKKEDIKIVFFN